MPEIVVAVCTPIASRPAQQFHTSLSALLPPEGGTMHKLNLPSRAIIEARTILTGYALSRCDPKVTHLLWIDDDMEFAPDSLRRLLAHDVPVVGGLCHMRRPPYYAVALREDGSDLFFASMPPEGLVGVDATGAGFLLVRRDVAEAVAARFGNGSWWQSGEGLYQPEDWAFCKRARHCGFPIMVDCSLDIGHVAEVVINRDIAGRLRAGRTV